MNRTFWERRKFFDSYGTRPNERVVRKKGKGIRETCPCCGYPMTGQGSGNICRLCSWEDEGQDDHNADEVIGIPNGNYSLVEARFNFERYLRMYSPDDEYHPPEAETKLSIKRRIIAAFDAIMEAQSVEELERLWQIIEDCEEELYRELKRSLYGELFAQMPCPFCGAILRTAKAKQCRKCGIDWHDS